VVAESYWRVKFARAKAQARAAEAQELAAARLPKLPTAHCAVILPTYERPESLARAVNSVLAQTFDNFVLLVISDGGDLPELPVDPRITTVKLTRNHRSPGLARNIGISLSRSSVVAFIDDDNTWRSEHLELTLGALTPGFGIAYADVRRMRVDGSIYDILDNDFDRSLHADQVLIDINSVVVRRAPGLGFDPFSRPNWMHPREDWEFIHRLTGSQRIAHVDEVTVDYTIHDGSFFTEWDQDALNAEAAEGKI
jgi:glycosyltransferase involved in cell wall biosynthesis